MTRLRDKGGASRDAAYEITNGFVDASGSPTQRPGTKWMFNWADPRLGKGAQANQTKGLMFFKGVFYRFTSGNGAGSGIVSGGGATYVILVLRHPTSTTATLSKIHYAKPMLGFPYVVAQFSDGLVAHYWLQNPPSWKANTFYAPNSLVQPTTPNGFYYQAVPWTPLPAAWTPLLQHNLGDVVQPTAPNGYRYYAQQLASGFGAQTTTTASATVPAIGSTFTLSVASTTGFNALAGNVVGIVDNVLLPTWVVQGTITAIAGTITVRVTAIVVNGGIATLSSGAVLSQQIDRSGANEPTWAATVAGTTTMDVSSAAAPPVAAAAPTQPGAVPPGTGTGGRYSNPGGTRIQPN